MIKKVKIDKNMRLAEIDKKKLAKAAASLKYYIENCDEVESKKFKYHERLDGILSQALSFDLEVPFLKDVYSVRLMMEGIEPMLPMEFDKLYSKFIILAGASPADYSLSTYEDGVYQPGKYRVVDDDGTAYEICWFED
ncbi:hypothetical protein [Sphingomonas sp. SORGH_AS_0879]|uniref:hypothetical protein n=1 Tax=Sphingomonas sp. SORGH_AS_0879 TaxID=3041790 RepID=UPI00277FD167|nr:hypothetical protein [Sphingomonas sp. SORGH_AS_0879]MDQ1232467.1 hypothetical protein [Sphingomonas sp. SORGH_AS_0879]